MCNRRLFVRSVEMSRSIYGVSRHSKCQRRAQGPHKLPRMHFNVVDKIDLKSKLIEFSGDSIEQRFR